MIKLLPLFALVLLAPAASAMHMQEEVGVVEWRQHIYATNALTGWDGDTLQVTLNRPHTMNVLETDIHIDLVFNVAITGSNVQRALLIGINATNLPFCTHTITTGGTLANKWSYGGAGHCPASTNPAGNPSVAVVGHEQTWTFSNTGTATVEFLVASVKVFVQETVILTTPTHFEATMGLTALEFTALLGLAIAGILLWSKSADYGVQFLGAILTVIAGVVAIFIALDAGLASIWSGAVAIGAILVLVGVYLVVRMSIILLTERGGA